MNPTLGIYRIHSKIILMTKERQKPIQTRADRMKMDLQMVSDFSTEFIWRSKDKLSGFLKEETPRLNAMAFFLPRPNWEAQNHHS